VFGDADLEQAAQGCAMGLFFNQGQVCASGSRILVQREIAEKFSRTLADIASSITVGDPGADGIQMGAVAKRKQFDNINAYIKKGIEEGATLLAGGVSDHGTGYFIKPTIFGNASNQMTIARERNFWPGRHHHCV